MKTIEHLSNIISAITQYAQDLRENNIRQLDFFGYLFLGSCLSIFLLAIENTNYVKQAERKLQDILIHFGSSDNRNMLNGKPLVRPTLIAIDNYSYHKWQRPAIVPRDKVAALINNIKQQGSGSEVRFVALDLDMAYGQTGTVNKEDKADNDEQLINSLTQAYESDLLIVATRSFLRPINQSGNSPASRKLQPDTIPVWDESVYDAVFSAKNNLLWSTTNYQVSADGNRRQWRLSELVCKNNKVHWLPSMQLLTTSSNLMAAAHTNKQITAFLTKQIDQINHFTNAFQCNELQKKKITRYTQLCKQQPKHCITQWQLTPSGDFTVDFSNKVQRFFYKVLPPQKGQLNPLTIESAAPLLENGWTIPPGQTIYIGGTFEEGFDWHNIPSFTHSNLPGVYLVINSTMTLTEYGQLKEAGWLIKSILLLLSIILMATLFSYLSHTWALAVAILLWAVLFAPLSLLMIQNGLLLTLAVPTLALQLLPVVIDGIKFITKAITDSTKKAQQQ